MNNFKIGEHQFNALGALRSPFILAEIGLNHNGDMTLASEMVAAAAEAGVHGVKFQSYFTDEFLCKSIQGAYDIFKSCELTPEQFATLKVQAESLGLQFISTPLTYSYVKILNEMDVPAFKIASCDMTYYDLIEAVVACAKPVIISTGMSRMMEIRELMSQDFLQNYPIILLHCISNYPPRLEDMHLNSILSFKEEFQVVMGLSDHSMGTAVGVGATALGAQFIEKHFTIDRNLEGPDQKMSMLPDEMKKLVRDTSDLFRALGRKGRPEVESEDLPRKVARRGLYASKKIQKGETLDNSNALFRRPPNSVDPRYIRLNKGVVRAAAELEGDVSASQLNS